jgi:hypothetical protein
VTHYPEYPFSYSISCLSSLIVLSARSVVLLVEFTQPHHIATIYPNKRLSNTTLQVLSTLFLNLYSADLSYRNNWSLAEDQVSTIPLSATLPHSVNSYFVCIPASRFPSFIALCHILMLFQSPYASHGSTTPRLNITHTWTIFVRRTMVSFLILLPTST